MVVLMVNSNETVTMGELSSSRSRYFRKFLNGSGIRTGIPASASTDDIISLAKSLDDTMRTRTSDGCSQSPPSAVIGGYSRAISLLKQQQKGSVTTGSDNTISLCQYAEQVATTNATEAEDEPIPANNRPLFRVDDLFNSVLNECDGPRLHQLRMKRAESAPVICDESDGDDEYLLLRAAAAAAANEEQGKEQDGSANTTASSMSSFHSSRSGIAARLHSDQLQHRRGGVVGRCYGVASSRYLTSNYSHYYNHFVEVTPS